MTWWRPDDVGNAVWIGLLLIAVGAKLQYLWWDGIPAYRKRRSPQPTPALQRVVFHSLGSFARYWHRYELQNAEVIDEVLDAKRSCLMLGYHSRCTVDLAFVLALLQAKILVTPLFFAMPLVDVLVSQLGLLPAKALRRNHATAKENDAEAHATFMRHLAQTDDPVVLLPGGIFECLKPHDQRYRLQWKRAPGFARAMAAHMPHWRHTAGVSVVPFFTTQSEDIYWTTPAWYDGLAHAFRYFYAHIVERDNVLAIPCALLAGVASLGVTLCPRPVRLTTVCGAPVHWQAADNAESFAGRVEQALQQLIDEHQPRAAAQRGEAQSSAERRGGGAVAVAVAVAYTAGTVLQNAVLLAAIVAAMVLTWLPLLVYCVARRLRRRADRKNHST